MVPQVLVIYPDDSSDWHDCEYNRITQEHEPLPVEGWNFNKINNQWHAYKTVKV